MVRILKSLAGIGAVLLLAAAPALAQTAECTVVFNGVAVERVDSLNSPLELETSDLLIFSGIDSAGTQSAVVRLYVGPVAIDSGTTTYATPQEEFTVTIDLNDVSPYGVGLYRAEAQTDGCQAGAWIRISGRFPFATLTGLTAIGLAVGGATGQLGAISSRRRWARSAAALGGIATGTGLVLIGQQFGRLQLSFFSLGVFILGTGFVGWVLASIFNPAQQEQRREARALRRQERRDEQREEQARRAVVPRRSEPDTKPLDTGRSGETRPPVELAIDAEEPPETAPREPEQGAKTVVDTSTRAGPVPAEPATPQPTAAAVPYWSYVLASTEVFDLTDHTKRVGTLEPGTWYLAKRTASGWAHVVVSNGVEGWVAESAIHRQG